MNCKICKAETENYIAGNLPAATRMMIEKHLQECRECSENMRIVQLTEKIFSEEKNVEPNPYLSARVMARIDSAYQNKETNVVESFLRIVLRPVIISVALAGAVILGIEVGKLAGTNNIANPVPDEISYLNDIEIESLSHYLTE